MHPLISTGAPGATWDSARLRYPVLRPHLALGAQSRAQRGQRLPESCTARKQEFLVPSAVASHGGTPHDGTHPHTRSPPCPGAPPKFYPELGESWEGDAFGSKSVAWISGADKSLQQVEPMPEEGGWGVG